MVLPPNQPPQPQLSNLTTQINQPLQPPTPSTSNLLSSCVTGGAGPWDHALHLLTSSDDSPRRDFDVASVLKSCMRSGREDGPGVMKWRDKTNHELTGN